MAKEPESDIEKLIRAELNNVTFNKKPLSDDYLVYATGFDDEKGLIRKYLEQDKVKKWVLTQCMMFDACYYDFSEKAKFNADDIKCEVVGASLGYFLNNLYLYKNKPLSESIKNQVLYSLRKFVEENNLKPKHTGADKIETLKSIGVDIYNVIEMVMPEFDKDGKTLIERF